MDGKIYRITATSEVMEGHRVFDVVFDDGTVIRADADHKWLTYTLAERGAAHKRTPEYREHRRATRPARGMGNRPDLAAINRKRAAEYTPETVVGGVRTTLDIKQTLRVGARVNHAIPVAAPLQLPERDLPIDPYVFGFWLGDGAAAHGRVTIGTQYQDDARRILTASGGYVVTKIPSEPYGFTIRGMQSQLRRLGVLNNKHVPEQYLFASIEQRIALLQGLMDTDGYASKDGQCEFYNSNPAIMGSVSRLLHTLGIKHAVRTKKPPRDTHHKESYRIKFVAPFPVFRLPAKASRQNVDLRETQKWRYIIDVREVDSEPVKCIAIDSPDHLYLAGTECVPTHNTDLALGLAGTAHRRSIIFRRVFPSVRGMIERSREIFTRDSFNESLHVWRLSDGRTIEFGAVQYLTDAKKHQGQPRDLFVFDEATEFPEQTIRFLMGWNRTTVPGQRCRVVLTFNPPMDDDGQWIVRFFAPWLDPEHPNPALDGELRYYAMIDGDETEVADGTPFEHDGETITPKSRTFIHASLKDNPILAATGYGATIDAMPEPLRSLLKGNFNAARLPNPWQVIPAEWVRLAQKRWQDQEQPERMTAIGVDVARGGKDKTVIASMYGTWVAPLQKLPGTATPDGPTVAAWVIGSDPPTCPIGVDVIGVGASAYDSLAAYDGLRVIAVNFASGSDATDRSRRVRFRNLRAEAYWKLREALDPHHGDNLALPPDAELLADLCAPTWKITPGGVLLESKEDLSERIGRSPDCGDAVVIAHWTAGQPSPADYLAFVELA